jgi:hypothetical protein
VLPAVSGRSASAEASAEPPGALQTDVASAPSLKPPPQRSGYGRSPRPARDDVCLGCASPCGGVLTARPSASSRTGRALDAAIHGVTRGAAVHLGAGVEGADLKVQVRCAPGVCAQQDRAQLLAAYDQITRATASS